MTASLAEFQQHALDKLLDPSCPSRVVVRSPAGSGIRRAVTALIRNVGTDARVLVLTPRREMAAQWVDRLNEEGLAVTLLETADAALELLEGPDDQPGQVLVATYPRALHGPSGRAMGELDYGLIVYDEQATLAVDELRFLNDRARRVVAMVPSGAARLPDWPLVVDVTVADLEAAVGRPLLLTVPFSASGAEKRLQREADQLFDEYGESTVRPADSGEDRSVVFLHGLLLDLAADLQKAPDPAAREEVKQRARLLQKTWNLVDRVENNPAADPRLRALDEVLTAELATGARCLVIAIKLSDVTYIATHLEDTERPPAAVLSARTDIDQRSAVQSLEPGEYVVAGPRVSWYLDSVAAPYTVILWPDQNAVLQQIIDQVGGAEGVRILQLAETKQP